MAVSVPPLFRVVGRRLARFLAVCAAIAGFVAPLGASAASAPAVIGVSGTHLTYAGRIYAFTGVDAYGLATRWGSNRGCGGEFSGGALTQLFSSLAPHSIVRFDAFEGGLGVDPSNDKIDFAGLDRVFAAARAHSIELIPVLANEWGGCDDGAYKDLAWFQGGWRSVPNPSLAAAAQLPALPLSYAQWVARVVRRYSENPALGMWEPIGEAEAGTCTASTLEDGCNGAISCPSQAVAAAALRHFFDQVGAEIRAIDPTHLIEAGLLGGDQCGLKGRHFIDVVSSPGIDVASFHDFLPHLGMGGDVGSTFLDRLAETTALGKPLLDAEAGLQAEPRRLGGGGPGCPTLVERSHSILAAARLQFERGVAGFMVWNLEPTPIVGCSYAVLFADPLLLALAPRTFSSLLPGR